VAKDCWTGEDGGGEVKRSEGGFGVITEEGDPEVAFVPLVEEDNYAGPGEVIEGALYWVSVEAYLQLQERVRELEKERTCSYDPESQYSKEAQELAYAWDYTRYSAERIAESHLAMKRKIESMVQRPMAKAPRDGTVIILQVGPTVYPAFYSGDIDDQLYPWILFDSGPSCHEGLAAALNGARDDDQCKGWWPLPEAVKEVAE